MVGLIGVSRDRGSESYPSDSSHGPTRPACAPGGGLVPPHQLLLDAQGGRALRAKNFRISCGHDDAGTARKNCAARDRESG